MGDTPTGGVEKCTTWAVPNPACLFDPMGGIDSGAYPKHAIMSLIYGVYSIESVWCKATISTLQVRPIKMFMYASEFATDKHVTTDGIGNLQMIPRIKFKNLSVSGSGVNFRVGTMFQRIKISDFYPKKAFTEAQISTDMASCPENEIFFHFGIVAIDGGALTDAVSVNAQMSVGCKAFLSKRLEITNPP